MADLSALHLRLAIEALGAPPALMDLKILDAARRFMREASVYRFTHPDITIVPQQGEYPLPSLPTDAELVRPLSMTYLGPTADRGRPLFPIAGLMLRPDYLIFESGLSHFTSPTYNKFFLTPIPTATTTGSLQNIVLQLRPSRTASTIDDDVLGRWEEEIMVGAQWLLYDMQDKPWTNKAEARRYKLRFTKAWTDAERELNKGFTRGDLRVHIPEL